jgi:hypothetical protein
MSHRKMLIKLRAQAGNPYLARLTGDRAHLLKGMEAKRGRRALKEGARRTVLYSRTNRRSIGSTISHRAYLLQGKITRTLQMPAQILTICIRHLFLKNRIRPRTITTTQSRAQAPLTSTIHTTIVCNPEIALGVAPASIRVPLTLADLRTSSSPNNSQTRHPPIRQTRTSHLLTSRNSSQ